MKKFRDMREEFREVNDLKYNQSNVQLLESWMHQMIRRGYFFVFVRFPDGRRAVNWLSIN